MKNTISSLLGCGALAALLSQCGDMVPAEMPPSANRSAANQRTPGSAAGMWNGVINYTVINGGTFQTQMQFSISPSLDRVTTVADDSGADTAAARRSGNAVSWSILASMTVTEFTLQPISAGAARVTSRAIQNGKVVATGGGVFAR